jgi:hypothetical protein
LIFQVRSVLVEAGIGSEFSSVGRLKPHLVCPHGFQNFLELPTTHMLIFDEPNNDQLLTNTNFRTNAQPFSPRSSTTFVVSSRQRRQTILKTTAIHERQRQIPVEIGTSLSLDDSLINSISDKNSTDIPIRALINSNRTFIPSEGNNK